MSTNQLYHTWFQRILQMSPHLRVTQMRNLAWLIVGMYQSKSVHLSKIAGKIPGQAELLSLARRLSRFLANPAIRVRELYAPIARQLLESRARHGEIRLIVDGTKVGFGHQLLIVALAYRRRALPIAWTWIKSARGHSSAIKQLALLAHVHRLIPEDVPISLVGDSEFGAVAVLRQLDTWDWSYVLRQKANHLVRLPGQADWQSFGSLIDKPGRSIWLGLGWLTAKHAYPVSLLAHWKTGEDEPWLLATSLLCKQAALRAYKRRMWIDEMFGDFKRHGFDLESTHLRHFQRLSRLTLAVALLYTWLIAEGARTIKSGHRHLVDRADRIDLSIFQTGWRFMERRLINALKVSIRLCPGFS